ncbi:helix-turn-helix domain-containing protein [Microbispora sp. CA-102843]|uniref:helix-turn-helix domain-containing protein n=1 Tax=Microbispora sp. CA-102843 TaxID=3239952 RepID=UPI003D9204AA
MGAPMSAAELSRELGISHALASHHLRCLDDAGLALARSLRERAGRRRAGEEGVTADAELWHDVRGRILAAIVDLHEGAAAPRTPGTIRVGATVTAFPLTESTGPEGR